VVPRERVIAAIEHKDPDRLPVDLGGSIVTGINGAPSVSVASHCCLFFSWHG